MAKKQVAKLYWVDGADAGVVEKQKQAHIGIMLDVINQAGEAGIGREKLKSTVESFLEVFEPTDRERWTKCTLDRHYNWLVKKYSEYVRAEYVAEPTKVEYTPVEYATQPEPEPEQAPEPEQEQEPEQVAESVEELVAALEQEFETAELAAN